MQAGDHMSESHETFTTFNDSYFGQKRSSEGLSTKLAPSKFPLWLKLPKELRFEIWTWHQHQRRFLRVLLEQRTEEHPEGTRSEDFLEDEDTSQDEWGAIFTEQLSSAKLGPKDQSDCADGPLRITFLDRPISPVGTTLQRVCRESNEAYTSFYPILLPALVKIPLKRCQGFDTRTERIIARLHPDLDIVSLQATYNPEIIKLNLLPLFLHTILQHDTSSATKRVGLRNLCVDLVHLGRHHGLNPLDGVHNDMEGRSSLPLHVLSSVRQTISHLRSLYFRLVTCHTEPRVMSGPLTGAAALPWFNASMPILPGHSWGYNGTVEAVEGVDPRLVHAAGAADLHPIWVGDELQPSLDVWAAQERAWGVRTGAAVAGGTIVRALVGVDAEAVTWPELYHRDLGTALQQEKTVWLSWLDAGTGAGRTHRKLFEDAQHRFLPGAAPTLTPEEWIVRRRSDTAVGFWLIDPQVLNAAVRNVRRLIPGKIVVDLSTAGTEAVQLWVLKKF